MTKSAGSGRGQRARREALGAGDVHTSAPEKHAHGSGLSREQRMGIIGHFAGKVAHDFNNVLTAIIGYGNLFLLRLDPGDPLRAHSEQLLAAAERGARMTQGLLTFGTRQPMNARPVNLNEVVERAAGDMTALLGEDTVLTLTLRGEPLEVLADVDLVEQMLANIVSNARDAMAGSGSLTVRTELQESGRDRAAQGEDEKVPSFAVVSVEDTGHGMDEATLERAFEPLYTTKPKGKGLGLGLAVVYGIARQHKGFVRVTSEIGRGTIVKVFLPLDKTAPSVTRGT